MPNRMPGFEDEDHLPSDPELSSAPQPVSEAVKSPDPESKEQQTKAGISVLAANVGDQPTINDTLGFSPYVEAIAAFLTNEVTKPPLTLSIEGEWGSGKSSFMLQLEDKLQKDGAKTVRFNAWRYDKDDAMWAAFALKFAGDLSNQLSWPERWLAHLKLFVSRFNWHDGWRDVIRLLFLVGLLVTIVALPLLMQAQIKEFVAPVADSEGELTLKTAIDSVLRQLAGAGGGLAYLALVIGLGAKLKDIVGTPLNVNLKQHIDVPDYQSRVSFIERFHEDFGRVAAVYGKKQKVFVFIDDLDRCELPRAAELMQALNLMISDSSYLVFIMGMDREKIAAGLAVKFEKLLPYLAPALNKSENGSVLGLEYGYGFIEKFIQLPFIIPQAGSEQLDPFLKKLLDSPKAVSTQYLKHQKKYRASGNES